MTKQTRKIVEKSVLFILFTIIAYCYLRYFMLPETGMLVRGVDGVWLESKILFPYTGELDFSEWPTPIQQAFLYLELGALIGVVILIPILDLIWDFLFGSDEY